MGLYLPYDSVAKGPVTYCLDELSIREDARQRLETKLNRIPDGFIDPREEG